MSVIYHIKKEGISDNVKIPGHEISSQELHRLLAEKLGVLETQIVVTNPITGLKFGEMEMIKDRYSVNVEKVLLNSASSINGIISADELGMMVQKARFFMIKSSNQQNIQKARDQSVWATTLSNQDKLRSAFLYHSHVFLFFATNRSYELKGLARMETEPAKAPDKSCWVGVGNIRLGGNFKIKWVRKTPLTALQIEKSLGPVIKDRIMRLSDGEEIDSQICKKVALLFEIPTSPYYEQKEEVVESKEVQKKIPNLFEIIGREVPLNFPMISQQFLKPPEVSGSKEKTEIKQVQQNQSKNKKSKRRKRSYSSDSDSSSSSESVSSSSSSRSRQKHRKKRKRRSSYSRSSSRSERKKWRKGRKERKERREKKEKKEKRESNKHKKSKKKRHS